MLHTLCEYSKSERVDHGSDANVVSVSAHKVLSFIICTIELSGIPEGELWS